MKSNLRRFDMSIYKGIKKRWVEGDYAGSYRPGEDGREIRSSFFTRYLGRENVKVPNVGFQPDGTPRPLIVATDLLLGKLDATGAQIAGQSNGLYYPDLGEAAEPTYAPLTMLLKRAEEGGYLTVFPGDQHENPTLFDPNAMTTVVLDPDMTKLSPRERSLVQNRYSRWIGKRLPAGIWREIFMAVSGENPRGDLIGKEERNFLPHCTEGQVEYVRDVLDVFSRQKGEIAKQTAQGTLVPEARFLPVPKDGLTVDMPGDERGMNGNKFDEILKAAYTGGYFQGDDHRHKKIAIVAGACYEYSVRLLIEHLVDADINVICMLSATKGLDLFSSKLHTAHYLKELYGKKLFFTYEWIEPLLGPEPKEWKKAVDNVKKFDEAHHNNWFMRYSEMIKNGITSMGLKIMLSQPELVKAAAIK
jgi:hypothetical protein